MSSDQLVFEDSITQESPSIPFQDKDFAYILDQNNGSYAGQVIFDSSSLSNVDRFANWSEAFIEIPLVLTLNTQTNGIAGFATANGQWAAGLKNGFWQVINSISVDYNGKTVVQLTPYTNVYVSFKMMTTLSDEDVRKWGPTIGFAKDDSLSYQYASAANPDGIYFSNTRNYVNVWTPNAADSKPIGNRGFVERQLPYCWDPSAAPFSTSVSTANCNTIGKSYHVESGDAVNGANTSYKLWYILATIRLKDVSDFFEKIPLVKGAQMKITLNTNTGTSTVTVAAGPTLTTTLAGLNMIGGTFPALCASATANNGMAACAGAGNGDLLLNLSIAKISNSALVANSANIVHPTLTACRMYVPLYSFNPEIAQQYISLGTKRKIYYNDIYSYTILSVGNGSTFNTLITNGITNPKRLIIVPFHASSAALSPLLNCFDTAPATTTPFAALTQLNIQVSGINVWSMNEQYDFEQFLQELSDTGLNGGKTTGLSSGLINQLDFASSYRYYVCNLGRRLPSEEGVPKSIQIMGTNSCSIALDLFVFVEYEKSVTIDVLTGLVEQ